MKKEDWVQQGNPNANEIDFINRLNREYRASVLSLSSPLLPIIPCFDPLVSPTLSLSLFLSFSVFLFSPPTPFFLVHPFNRSVDHCQWRTSLLRTTRSSPPISQPALLMTLPKILAVFVSSRSAPTIQLLYYLRSSFSTLPLSCF